MSLNAFEETSGRDRRTGRRVTAAEPAGCEHDELLRVYLFRETEEP